MESRDQQTFQDFLRDQLALCGLRQSDLHALTGIPEPQISGWMSGDRRVGLEAIGRVAHAIAGQYAKLEADRAPNAGAADARGKRRASSRSLKMEVSTTQPRYRGPEDLVAMIARFMQTAGYRFGDVERDLIWQRLSGSPLRRRKLRVGWYEKEPLAYMRGGSMVGIAKAVTERVAEFLSVKLTWEFIELSNITSSLRNGDVDLICCEYIGAESNLFDVWLSDVLPGIAVVPVGIVSVAAREDAISFEKRNGINTAYPNYEKLRFFHTNTLIGQSLLTSLVPYKHIDRFLSHDNHSLGLDVSEDIENQQPEPLSGSLIKCVADLLQRPTENGRVRCFATDTLTYFEAISAFPDQIALLPPAPGHLLPEFGLCFALHPDEGGKFGTLLNKAIASLQRMQFFERVAYPEYASLLQANHALVEEIKRQAMSDLPLP